MSSIKNINSLLSLLHFASKHIFTTIIVLLILLVLAYLGSIFSYKKSSKIKVIYNCLMNILPLAKRDYILIASFSKKEANFSSVKKMYSDPGFLCLELKTKKLFNENNGSITKENLEKIIEKQNKTIKKAKKREKNSNSLIYLGFPHVPLAFLDGFKFSDTDNPVLYEYNGSDSESMSKGFYELADCQAKCNNSS